MSHFINTCLICLKHSKNLVLLTTQDANGTTIESKLEYFLPELELDSHIPKYICIKCGNNLSRCYKFKQKCLQNITTYKKKSQPVTMADGSHKYFIPPDFVCKEENVSDENNSDTNILEYQSETNVDVAHTEEVTIKEERNKELVLNDELKSLMCEVKEENHESNNTCNMNENLQLSDDSVSFSIGNIGELDEKEQSECPKVKLKSPIRLHGIPNKCQNYDEESMSYGTSNQNVLEHQDEKIYECEICKKSFNRFQNLKRHKVIHTNRKPYTCEICKKSFRLLQYLKNHHAIHSSSKSYTCKVCNESFRHLNTLKVHQIVHTGGKPVTCEVCNKSFRQLGSLREHRSTHSGLKPFTCEICNKSFRLLCTLKRHHLTHSNEKPFTCEMCNSSFKYLQTLNRHKIVHIGKK